MNLDPKERKKIRARINRYERNFKRSGPFFDDGGGSRFLLGPLYLLLDDLEGALKHYKWFQRKFSDSSDEPMHTLSWALALYRAKKPKDAEYRLRKAHLANPYLIPRLLGVPHGQPEIKRWRGWDAEGYLEYIDSRLFEMWTPDELMWLSTIWSTPDFQELVRVHSDLVQRLEHEPVGPARSALVEALSSLVEREKPKRHLSVVENNKNWPSR